MNKYVSLALACILFVCGASFAGYLQLIVKIPLIYPVGLILGALIAEFYLWSATKNYRLMALGFILVLLLFVVASFMHDYSSDGQWYHMPAMMSLGYGWNPFYEHFDTVAGSFWPSVYPKAFWMLGGEIFAITGSLLAGKAAHLILAIALYILSFDVVNRFGKLNISRFWQHIIAFILSFSPVVGAQIFTSYVDAFVYDLLLAMLYIWLYARYKVLSFKWAALFLLVTTSFLVNLKFTAVGYAGILWLGLLHATYLYDRVNLKRIFCLSAVSMVVSIFVIGFNPYITNFIDNGHPFWPVRGNHDIENVMLSVADDTFLQQNRVIKLVESNFAYMSDEHQASLSTIEYKIPGMIDKQEKRFMATYPDRRLAGFGAWFSLALVIAFVIVAVMIYKRDKWNGYSLIIFWLLVSVLINPECWHARYASQLAALPILIALAALNNNRLKYLTSALLVVLALNSAMFLGGHIGSQYVFDKRITTQMKELKKSAPVEVYDDGVNPAFFITRFDYFNVPYVKVPKDDSRNYTTLVFGFGAGDKLRIYKP